jgi:glycosyltransferase involved in cell wall biosynthesis
MPVIEKYGFSPNKLSEYMAFHRPIVLSCRAFNNPVEEAEAGFSVEPESPEALAEGILRLRRTTAATRWTMGANARRYALEHHDMRKLSLRLGDFLARIAGQSRQRTGMHRAA